MLATGGFEPVQGTLAPCECFLGVGYRNAALTLQGLDLGPQGEGRPDDPHTPNTAP